MKLKNLIFTLTAIFIIFNSVKIFTLSLSNGTGINFENEQTATIVGQDGVIMRTENGGLNWILQSSNITNVLNSIEFISLQDSSSKTINLQLVVGENGIILRSIDNGLTWNIISSGTTEHLNDVIIYSPFIIYICGDNGTLLRSTDLGEIWVPVTINTPFCLNHMALLGSGNSTKTINAIVIGDNGTCFATINFMDWFSISVPTSEDILSVTSSENILICGTFNGTILKSTNRGYNWVATSSGITTNIYDLVFISPTIVIGSSENGIMIRSINAGNNWVIVTTPVNFDLFALEFGTGSFGIASGGIGTEIYTTNSGKTWFTYTRTVKYIAKIDKVELNQNYPNPFNPSTIINYSVNDNSSISIKVYDMTGREVRTLVNSFQKAGAYSVNFKAENLSSGIYFYVLRVNNGVNEITRTMRMILTK